MLAFIGTPQDRAEAQSILRQADAAFTDCRHTREENQEKYGLLAHYATPLEQGAAATTHSLTLWSAHLGDSEGYLWVYYSCEALDTQGNILTASRNIPSLWQVQKDASGQWVVSHIKEHP